MSRSACASGDDCLLDLLLVGVAIFRIVPRLRRLSELADELLSSGVTASGPVGGSAVGESLGGSVSKREPRVARLELLVMTRRSDEVAR